MSDTAGQAMILALMLILPVSALVAQRLPLSRMMKYAAMWMAVFGVGLVLARLFT